MDISKMKSIKDPQILKAEEFDTDEEILGRMNKSYVSAIAALSDAGVGTNNLFNLITFLEGVKSTQMSLIVYAHRGISRNEESYKELRVQYEGQLKHFESQLKKIEECMKNNKG